MPNRPKCIWKVNRKNEKQKVKDKLAAKHGITKKKEEVVAFEDDEFELEDDDDDETDALDEEDDHPNPFIL